MAKLQRGRVMQRRNICCRDNVNGSKRRRRRRPDRLHLCTGAAHDFAIAAVMLMAVWLNRIGRLEPALRDTGDSAQNEHYR